MNNKRSFEFFVNGWIFFILTLLNAMVIHFSPRESCIQGIITFCPDFAWLYLVVAIPLAFAYYHDRYEKRQKRGLKILEWIFFTVYSFAGFYQGLQIFHQESDYLLIGLYFLLLVLISIGVDFLLSFRKGNFDPMDG